MEKKFLHVGCGHHTKEHTTKEFRSATWQEVRLDIDESVNPDILASVLDLSSIDSNSFDSIFSSHNIEHVHAHEIPLMLEGFLRVLKEDGYIVVTCPNLLQAAKLIVQDKLTEPAYISPIGPITPLDILYGHNKMIEGGNEFMAHKTGFTPKSLGETLASAGFANIALSAIDGKFDMWAIATKNKMERENLASIVAAHIPQ